MLESSLLRMSSGSLSKLIYIIVIFCALTILPFTSRAKDILIANSKVIMTLGYGRSASITSLVVNGQKVISSADGIFTSVTIGGVVYSSLHLLETPVMVQNGNVFTLKGIVYGDKGLKIRENWVFTVSSSAIKWAEERSFSKAVKVDEAAMPAFNFDQMSTWEGAYQGYGGLAWFYLFNEKLCTYGVHTHSSNFWNSETGNGLNITVDAPGRNVAMKYTVTVSNKQLLPKHDAGTNRRRFIRARTDVWSPFAVEAASAKETITFSYFDVEQKYGRGIMKGIDGGKVSAVLNTIARIGVIDSLHFGGNSWHTPYGPICLHEQYIGQLGLAINDPAYLRGYQSTLDYYRDHAIKPDGRVYPRWAYTNEDAMPGQFNKDGFYEAQWGILMDSNPDLVSNIADLYDLNGNKAWVKTHQQSSEKALDWIIRRDSNSNGLVEMITESEREARGSDWIDIIWASYENAFVNAKLYYALVKWAEIERQLNNPVKANAYTAFAAKLKTSFNKSISDGGFWDPENGCYVHCRNMVTPVNFMAIAYGICDDAARKKIILDNIEKQMKIEKLFFWPLAMSSYAPGEGKEWQFPFPSYENGDLFLSWGSIAVKAYADYDPALALKYVKNVLQQYSKDGLAFQRYGRAKQDGLGDDILSGNSLAIVGLYQSIYGINPLYNRFYLDPHITSELAGTSLNYRFRGQQLKISLDNNSYSVSNKMFKIRDSRNFGFNAINGELSYFHENSAKADLTVRSAGGVSLDIRKWDAGSMEWQQSAVQSIGYTIHKLKPAKIYLLSVNGSSPKKLNSNLKGELLITRGASKTIETITLSSAD
jgi:hypothetical protein